MLTSFGYMFVVAALITTVAMIVSARWMGEKSKMAVGIIAVMVFSGSAIGLITINELTRDEVLTETRVEPLAPVEGLKTPSGRPIFADIDADWNYQVNFKDKDEDAELISSKVYDTSLNVDSGELKAVFYKREAVSLFGRVPMKDKVVLHLPAGSTTVNK